MVLSSLAPCRSGFVLDMEVKRILILIVAAAVFCLPQTACEFAIACQHEIHQALESPDSSYTASIFSIECGALSAVNMYGNLRSAGSPFKPSKGFLDVGKNLVSVDLQWRGSRLLAVTLICQGQTCDERTVQRETAWNDVEIRYRLLGFN